MTIFNMHPYFIGSTGKTPKTGQRPTSNIDIHNKRFVSSSENSSATERETVFHYFSDGSAIYGSYDGGEIKKGSFVGKYKEEDKIELLYHCVTNDGKILGGWSFGVLSESADGLVAIKFEWGWLYGQNGGGTSSYIELRP